MSDRQEKETENLRQWQAACNKLDYLRLVGYRPGDTAYDEARDTIRRLQRELKRMQNPS